MEELIKTIWVVNYTGDYGEHVFFFNDENELIDGYSRNDLNYNIYVEGLLETFGHEVFHADLEDIFDSEEDKRAWEIEYHGYNAYED